MYYVYVYYHPDTMVPFYVGKGKGQRKYDHWYGWKKHSNELMRHTLTGLKQENKKPTIEEVFHTDNENAAFEEETKLIKLYGRIDLGTGTLCNLMDHVNLPFKNRKGYKWTKEQRKHIKEYYKNNPKGKSMDQYNIKGEFIQTFLNVPALRAAGFDYNGVQYCCTGHIATSQGFRWEYHDTLLRPYKDQNKKAVLQIDKVTNYILNTFDSIKEAGMTLNIAAAGINRCVLGRQSTFAGYIWKYRDFPTPQYEPKIIKPIKHSTKSVVQLDNNYNIIYRFDNAKHAEEITGIRSSNIQNVCTGKYLKAAGYIWRYEDSAVFIYNNQREKAVIQMDENYNILNRFNSAAEASRCTNIGIENISSVLRNRTYSAGGFLWSYADQSIARKEKPTQKKKVVQMTLKGKIINTFNSVVEASINSKVHRTGIAAVCRKEKSVAGGFKWKYLNPN